MEPVDERDLVLARRLKVGVRLIIYPLLLGLVVLAWQKRGGGEAAADGPPLTAVSGRSSQGLEVGMTRYDAQVESLRLPVRMRCADGVDRLFTWTPSSDIRRQRGTRLTAHRRSTARPYRDGWVYAYEAWLTLELGGGRPHGTVRVANTFKNGERMLLCDSYDVRVSFAPARGT